MVSKDIKNGYLIHEGTTNGQPFVVIATGVKRRTKNGKTGNMIQLWIILKDVHPVAAVRSGLDAHSICSGCPFAGGNGCYVVVHQAPAGVWRAYQRGLYKYLPPRDYHAVFGGRKVRFGAYGNPTLLPFSVAKAIAGASDGWTGYFHNWKQMSIVEAHRWNSLFMASTETKSSLELADSLQLRTFHVSTEKPEGHMECVSDSHGISCAKCMLCQGTNKPAKPVWIAPHGYRTTKAQAKCVQS